MDQLIQQSSSSSKAYCPSWLLPHPMDVAWEDQDVALQAPKVNPSFEEGFNQLSLDDSSCSQHGKQSGSSTIDAGMQQTKCPQTITHSNKEGEQLSLLNLYKEKSIKLEAELAKITEKSEVLSGKHNYFSGIAASCQETVADYKNQLDEMKKKNQKLQSEVAEWKGNCLRMQKSTVMQENPVNKNPYKYKNPLRTGGNNNSQQLVEPRKSSRHNGGQKTYFNFGN